MNLVVPECYQATLLKDKSVLHKKLLQTNQK